MNDPTRSTQSVDYAALRTNQVSVIVLLVAGFILDSTVLVGLTFLLMLLGTLIRKPGFVLVYRLLRRLGLAKPDPVNDNLEPHLFAQAFGAVVLAGSLAALLLGATVVGWGLVWLVIALAALNVFGGFCLGCAVYYWLNRLGSPGFGKSPPPGTIPGRRPPLES